MKAKYLFLGCVSCMLTSQAMAEGQGPVARLDGCTLGYTEVPIRGVDEKDPAGELEKATHYYSAEDLANLRKADGQKVSVPMYFIIKFLEPGRYRVTLLCQADGNHQVSAHAPLANRFEPRMWQDVVEPKVLTLEFDADYGRTLIFNCTQGRLHVDSFRAERMGESPPAQPQHAPDSIESKNR